MLLLTVCEQNFEVHKARYADHGFDVGTGWDDISTKY